MRFDVEGRLVSWNTAMASATGYPAEEMLGKTAEQVIERIHRGEASEIDRADFSIDTATRTDEGYARQIFRITKKDGGKCIFEVTARPLGGKGFIYAATEVTEQYILHQRLHTDDLTGCPNGLALEEFLKERHQYHEKKDYVIVYGDVDSFKSLNEAYGHDGGDFALRAVFEFFRDHVRLSRGDTSDIVFRSHRRGDEMAIVFDRAKLDGAYVRLGIVCEELGRTIFEVNGQGEIKRHIKQSPEEAMRYREGMEYEKNEQKMGHHTPPFYIGPINMSFGLADTRHFPNFFDHPAVCSDMKRITDGTVLATVKNLFHIADDLMKSGVNLPKKYTGKNAIGKPLYGADGNMSGVRILVSEVEKEGK